ncbi:SKOR, partial [Symbiodinium sp. CCMP2592]
ETCAFLLREGKVDPNPLDRFLHTPLDDAIRHGHKATQLHSNVQGIQPRCAFLQRLTKDVAELLIKFKGRPSTDDEYLSTVRDEFLKQMEEEKARKDTDKLDKELKTHKFSEVLERLARLRSDLEDDVYQFMTSAANIRYELCRILHMNMFLHDESSRTRAGWDRLTQQLDDHSLTTQKLADLLERDLRQLDSSASRILKTISGDVFPWLNSACNNFHTRGLVLLLLPNFSDHLSKLVVVLNHATWRQRNQSHKP